MPLYIECACRVSFLDPQFNMSLLQFIEKQALLYSGTYIPSVEFRISSVCMMHRFQIGAGAHPTSYPAVAGDKAVGAWREPLISI